MRVIGDKNQISEDVFDFMISYLSFPQKSIRSELANFFPSVYIHVFVAKLGKLKLMNSKMIVKRCKITRNTLNNSLMVAKHTHRQLRVI